MTPEAAAFGHLLFGVFAGAVLLVVCFIFTDPRFWRMKGRHKNDR